MPLKASRPSLGGSARSTGSLIPCGVALVCRGDEVLIAQRKKSDSFGGYWEFPGGKKNKGETFEQCVAREILEETGVAICVGKKIMELRRRYHQKTVWLNFYLCTHVSGEPQALDCDKALWVKRSMLGHYRFPPANERVIKKLKELSDG